MASVTSSRSDERTLTSDQVTDIQVQLMKWGKANFRPFPWRKKMPLWKGLLVEVMLQRTRAAQVEPVFREFDRRFKRASDLNDVSDDELRGYVKSLGLRWRQDLFVGLCREIARRAGRLPRDVERLMALPGVGSYASTAALSLHGGHQAAIIDANTVRIVARILGRKFDGETRRKPWLLETLRRMTPDNGHRSFNYSLLDLGATVCTPKSPGCPECPIQIHCSTGTSPDS